MCIKYDMHNNKYVGPYCRAEKYADHIDCCPLVSHGMLTGQTDGQTPNHYIMLSTMDVVGIITKHLMCAIKLMLTG